MRMTLFAYMTIGAAVWAAVYMASVTAGLWHKRNQKGALVALLLTAAVLLIPLGVQFFLRSQ